MTIKIGNHLIGKDQPTYFIADIAANHDGDLDRAKMLIQSGEGSRCGRGQVPEFPGDQDCLGLRFHTHERPGFSPGFLEEIRDRSIC